MTLVSSHVIAYLSSMTDFAVKQFKSERLIRKLGFKEKKSRTELCAFIDIHQPGVDTVYFVVGASCLMERLMAHVPDIQQESVILIGSNDKLAIELGLFF